MFIVKALPERASLCEAFLDVYCVYLKQLLSKEVNWCISHI